MPTYQEALSNFLPTTESLKAFATSAKGQQLVSGFGRLLIWLGLLRRTYNNQPAAVLLLSAHSEIIEFWALVPLRLIHSASGSLRTTLDLVFSFSYYTYHPKEWEAICSGRGYWEGRAGILEWHARFTRNFQGYNKKFGITADLDKIHEDLSCYVHGIPAKGLPMIQSLDRAELDKIDVSEVIELATSIDGAMNGFLIGVFHELLPALSPSEYKSILAGLDKKKLADCGIPVPSP